MQIREKHEEDQALREFEKQVLFTMQLLRKIYFRRRIYFMETRINDSSFVSARNEFMRTEHMERLNVL
jgi:hypothetical protein